MQGGSGDIVANLQLDRDKRALASQAINSCLETPTPQSYSICTLLKHASMYAATVSNLFAGLFPFEKAQLLLNTA